MPSETPLIIFAVIFFIFLAHEVWEKGGAGKWFALLPLAFAGSMLWDNFAWVRQFVGGLMQTWGFVGEQGAESFAQLVWFVVVVGAVKYIFLGKSKSKKKH